MASKEELKQRIIVESDQMSTVLAGVVIAVIAWSGLVWVITNTLPTLPNRWIFFALLHTALTGTTLPFVRFFHQRFSREGGLYIRPGLMIRQASWIGLLGSACAWLLIPRLLSLPLIAILAIALILIEGILGLRSRLVADNDILYEQ